MFSLSDLQLRPVQLGKQQPAATAAAAASARGGGSLPQADLSYTLEWTAIEAASAAGAASRLLESSGAWRLEAAGSRIHTVWPPHAADAARTAIAQLASIQQAAEKLPQAPAATGRLMPAAVLHSRGVPEGALQRMTPHCQSAASGRALLRVAAQEIQAVSWSALAADHLDASQASAANPLTATDVFGAVCSGGTWLAPRLAAASSTVSHPSAGSTPVGAPVAASAAPGTVLVTGGLGDIGFLVAMWLMEAGSAAHIVLLGRSGRAAKLASALQVLVQ